MRTVRCRRGIVLGAATLAAAGFCSLPATAAGQTESETSAPSTAGIVPSPGPAPAKLSLRLIGERGGKVHVGRRVKVLGRIRPFVPGQRVEVKLLRRGHVVKKKRPFARRIEGRNAGRFKLRSPGLIKPGKYRAKAVHAATPEQAEDRARSRKFKVSYPDLDPGNSNSDVRLFNKLLGREGYHTSHGRHYGSATQRAVLAFRKVNRMRRTTNASPGIFRTLAAGRGGFKLKYPGAGRHVEVDISRQVMALADHGKAQHTFHVSTGAPATPTIRGHYRFYRREPGYNSHAMYYSVYWHGGYAIHGYGSVPRYPASHGCVREPIPNAVFIYNWVKLGMSIYTYR
jgi:hypothetical protein